MLTTILKSFDTFVEIATKSGSITLSLTGIGFVVLPISTAKTCGQSKSKQVTYEIVMPKKLSTKTISRRSTNN